MTQQRHQAVRSPKAGTDQTEVIGGAGTLLSHSSFSWSISTFSWILVWWMSNWWNLSVGNRDVNKPLTGLSGSAPIVCSENGAVSGKQTGSSYVQDQERCCSCRLWHKLSDKTLLTHQRGQGKGSKHWNKADTKWALAGASGKKQFEFTQIYIKGLKTALKVPDTHQTLFQNVKLLFFLFCFWNFLFKLKLFCQYFFWLSFFF